MRTFRWFVALIVGAALLVGVAIANGASYTEQWDGRGTDSERCGMIGEEGRTEAGWIHWVFATKGDSTSASLVLGGTGSGTFAPGEPLNANVWHFYTPYFELDGLTATISLFGGMPGPGGGLVISDYCPGGRSIEVRKTAFTEFVRRHFWDIDKDVDTENGHTVDDGIAKIWLYMDGSGDETATWTVDVTYQGFEDSGFVVYGDIEIENIAASKTAKVITSITDDLGIAGYGNIAVDCGPTFMLPYTIAYGDVLLCSYRVEFLPGEVAQGTYGTNRVFVAVQDDFFSPYDASAAWSFDAPTLEIDKTVTIKDLSDLFGDVELGTVTAPDNARFTYTKHFAWADFGPFSICKPGPFDNTARIVETFQEASARLKVNVECERLDVSKTAVTTFTRKHFWDIDKEVDTEYGHTVDDGIAKIWLYADGSGDETATWTIDVSYVRYEDSGFRVTGTITIENTGYAPAVIESVVDVLAGMPVAVDCGVTFPYTLPVGQTLTCTYGQDGYAEGINEVTVTTQNHVMFGNVYTAFAPVVWGEPTTEIDKTVTIKDIGSLFGEQLLGTVTAPNGAQFTYTKDFSIADYAGACGPFSYPNTASIIETGQSASALLKVNVQCFVYESAWAMGDPNVSFCSSGFSNWGWTNPILPGAYQWPLYAGAAQCDPSKGTLVGTVTVVYAASGDVAVTFNVAAPYGLGSTAVYAGYNMFPMLRNGRYTVAPGQYTNGSPFNGSQVYVIAHANVGMPAPNFGP